MSRHTARRYWLSTVVLLVAFLALHAQQEHLPAGQAPAQSLPFVLRTNARLVVVDVTAEDSHGHPVHGLKASDFTVEEDRKQQSAMNFEEHSFTRQNEVEHPAMPAMPAGSFTNYSPVGSDGPLNVVLLDTLNTPMADQSYVRKQLQQYVKRANPHSRIAIFGLATHLILLQGFTSDPTILKNAVEHKLTPRGSVLLDDPSGSNMDQASASETMSANGASASAVAAIQQFESEEASFQSQMRIRYTLDAFNQIARYLANFPGRKNLIWFSGSFPITIFGDPNTANPFAGQADFSAELRDTSSLLDRARVAVYPVDAGGLQIAPMFDAASSGRSYVNNPRKTSADLCRFSSNNAAGHMTMDQIAEDTGGHAFYNTNDLAEAVTKAIDTGANYYTLTYAPSNPAQDGAYRNIHVALRGQAAALGYKLTYRRGYFSDDPNARHSLSSVFSLPSPVTTGSAHYGELVMEHGAPTPTEIIFKATILPASTVSEDTVAEHNVLNSAHPVKGPFRRYQITCTALGADFDLPQQTDGHRQGSIEFVTYVYDSNGKLINIAGQTFQLDLAPATYAQLMKTGVSAMLQVSAPEMGESFFRIAVHDMKSGRFGIIELPNTMVAHLPPVSTPASDKN